MRRAKRTLRSLVHRALLLAVRCVAPFRRRSRARGRGVRSLWAGTPILNMGINARAEGRIVERADSLVYETYFVTDEFTYDLSRWMRIPFVNLLLPYAVLAWAILRYDRFHFYHDRGLLPPDEPFRFNRDELRLLRRLDKQVFFWTYGADVRTTERTRALGEHNCCIECPAPGRACACDESRGRENSEFIAERATAVFAMGDMAEYTPDSRNDLFFWPVDLGAEDGRRYAPGRLDAAGDRPLRVVHAPNHREFKGTRHLEAAVARLEEEGLPIELVLVERVPNERALEIYRSADVVFDQCLIGFHGYFVHEAMALGKAVMCFIRKPEYLLAPEECPIVIVEPHTIADRLRELAGDRDRLLELGLQGRRYIEKHHTLERFADRLRSVYDELERT